MNSKIKQVKFAGYNCNVVRRCYPNGRLALELIDTEDGMPVATATVNLPDVDIKDDEVFIKSYSENEGMMDMLQKEKIIGETLATANVGFTVATLHKLLYI